MISLGPVLLNPAWSLLLEGYPGDKEMRPSHFKKTLLVFIAASASALALARADDQDPVCTDVGRLQPQEHIAQTNGVGDLSKESLPTSKRLSSALKHFNNMELLNLAPVGGFFGSLVHSQADMSFANGVWQLIKRPDQVRGPKVAEASSVSDFSKSCEAEAKQEVLGQLTSLRSNPVIKPILDSRRIQDIKFNLTSLRPEDVEGCSEAMNECYSKRLDRDSNHAKQLWDEVKGLRAVSYPPLRPGVNLEPGGELSIRVLSYEVTDIKKGKVTQYCAKPKSEDLLRALFAAVTKDSDTAYIKQLREGSNFVNDSKKDCEEARSRLMSPEDVYFRNFTLNKLECARDRDFMRRTQGFRLKGQIRISSDKSAKTDGQLMKSEQCEAKKSGLADSVLAQLVPKGMKLQLSCVPEGNKVRLVADMLDLMNPVDARIAADGKNPCDLAARAPAPDGNSLPGAGAQTGGGAAAVSD